MLRKITRTPFNDVNENTAVFGGVATGKPWFEGRRHAWVVDVKQPSGIVLAKTLAEARVEAPLAVAPNQVVEGTPLACGYAVGPVTARLGMPVVMVRATSGGKPGLCCTAMCAACT
jgi:hypothetical protein